MSKIQITGGRPLYGTITIDGAKNSLLPIMTACLMVNGSVRLRHVPQITDLRQMLHILAGLGCHIHRQSDTVKIDVQQPTTHQIDATAARQIRGSIFVMGALLARLGAVKLPYPGGCSIGSRPIDLHLNLLRQIGVKIKTSATTITATYAPKPKRRTTVLTLDFPSVGATENIIQATTLGCAGNTYQIIGVAKEPEIVDLCNFLNQCGAQITGAGTDTITVTSVAQLHGTDYTPIPDRINTGTYLIAVTATGGDVILRNVVPAHNVNLINKLKLLGAKITTSIDTLHIIAKRRRHHNFMVHTAPYPGFPTDLQSQFCVLLTLTHGRSTITENLFENRFRYLPELIKLGAKITTQGNQAHICGVTELQAQPTPNLCPSAYRVPAPAVCTGTKLNATDLRGGVALVIAALATKGTCTIDHADYIARGHQDIVKDLQQLGANIVALP